MNDEPELMSSNKMINKCIQSEGDLVLLERGKTCYISDSDHVDTKVEISYKEIENGRNQYLFEAFRWDYNTEQYSKSRFKHFTISDLGLKDKIRVYGQSMRCGS